MFRTFAIIITFVFCASCANDNEYIPVKKVDSAIIKLPETSFNYVNLDLPKYFLNNDSGNLPSSINGLDNTPTNNPVTDAGATLGRVLFYDAKLSKNNTVACASCHRQELGFTDSPVLSLGFDLVPTRRNSISLINQMFYKRGHFFWDERATTMEDQVLQPILDKGEMGLTESEIIQRVSERSFYSPLFLKAFGSGTISLDKIAKALSQFIRTIVSTHSKYDQGRAKVNSMLAPFPNFNDSENLGKELFLKSKENGGAGCYNCHTTEAFVSVNSGPKNNGLDLVSTNDLGVFETFSTDNYKGAFKIPTLRNISFSAPYMHDGRFKTLQQVIEHYNSGVQNHSNLSEFLKDASGNPQQLNLTEEQKKALLDFLKTLTDPDILHNEKWSDPFINQRL